jgi:hypothetical protein
MCKKTLAKSSQGKSSNKKVKKSHIREPMYKKVYMAVGINEERENYKKTRRSSIRYMK